MSTFVNANRAIPANTYYRSTNYVPQQTSRPVADVRDDYERASVVSDNWTQTERVTVPFFTQAGTLNLSLAIEWHYLFARVYSPRLAGLWTDYAASAITSYSF